MKKIGILGCTGSIGQKALQIVQHLPQDLHVVALAAKSNIELLEIQARTFSPEVIAVWDKKQALKLQKKIPHIPVLAGEEGVIAVATHSSVDLLLSAISGFSGILPTLRAMEAKKNIALANKEVLVAAGELVMQYTKKNKTQFIPVDSEHTALFQCVQGEKKADIRKMVLTASGGPFREYTFDMLKKVNIQAALNHPNYRMGSKVTIDSSTLMNKGLEMIEAHYLYDIPVDQIEVVVHQEQVIHSFVEFVDGSILAQLCEPDMLIPIQYALTYPERKQGILPPFDFTKYSTLHFAKADTEKFRCLALAYQALREGGSMPCFMNAANEVLVERFLQSEISWLDIGQKLENLMQRHLVEKTDNFEHLLNIDVKARNLAKLA